MPSTAALRRSFLWFVASSLLTSCGNVEALAPDESYVQVVVLDEPEPATPVAGYPQGGIDTVLPPQPPVKPMPVEDMAPTDEGPEDEDPAHFNGPTPDKPIFVDHPPHIDHKLCLKHEIVDRQKMSPKEIEAFEAEQIRIITWAKTPHVVVDAQGDFLNIQEQQVDGINDKLDDVIEQLQQQQGISAVQKSDEDYIRIVRGEGYKATQRFQQERKQE